MRDTKWPHKHGGKKKTGDEGNAHNFAMVITLLNVFAAYHDIHRLDKNYHFEQLCIRLSDDLFEYCQEL
jgi:hypothetical protein